jgi:hypothetical protein
MAQLNGVKTANIMDIPLSVESVVAPYLGDNGYKFEGFDTIRVLSIANGTLSTYDETSATAPFGAPALVVPNEQTLTLAYNKSMLLRIQAAQIQAIPVSQFSKQVAVQQAAEVFIPAHDAYSIGKVYAARPVGNRVYIQLVSGTPSTLENAKIRLKFAQMLDKVRTGGGSIKNTVVWVGYDFSSQLADAVNFTGSDAGYADAKAGWLGKFKGASIVEAPDAYLGAGVYCIAVDKRAVVNVTPKMDPKAGGMKVIEDVPLFSGIELQLRDRGDTFVLNQKARVVASLEEDPAA